jgi:hypothetical protein
MNKFLLPIAVLFLVSNTITAQITKRVCGTLQHHEYLKQTRPNYEKDLASYEQQINQYLADKANNKLAAMPTVTVPVVVHVLYNTAAENITDAQAASQVQVLNDDFAKLNADASKVTQPGFAAIASGANIRFCLAQRDPNGNATTGVVHKSTSKTSFSTNDDVKSSATGGDDPWDVTKYVNIWVCDLGSMLLGYGEFPTSSLSNTWGLVIHYNYTGSGGSAVAPYNKGRTGTHEFGHCFNLLHIWGDDGSSCSGSDQCADTPNQASEHYGCFTQGSIQTDACSSSSPGTMWMNFMDYTDDACMYMFTANQVSRMEAVVNTSPWNVLATSNGCTPVVANALDAKLLNVISPSNGMTSCTNSVTPRIVISNNGSTTLTSATINYKMDSGTTQTYAWSGSLASSASATVNLNNYTGLSAAAHTFSVWITAPNGGADQNNTNNSATSTFTVANAPAGAVIPFTEGFEGTAFPPSGWVIQKKNTVSATNTWMRLANTTGLVAGSTAIAKMDNYSGSTDISGQVDALRSPAISFVGASSSLKLKFDVAHRFYSTTDIDSLNIYVSTNCEGSWTRIYTKGGAQLATVAGAFTSAYNPGANTEWRRDSVSLSAFTGQPSVYVKFESRSGWGNNVFIDNINISQAPVGLHDLELNLPVLEVFPNPTSGIISLSLSNVNNDKQTVINVLNAFGQVVATPIKITGSTYGLQTVDLSHLANGVYFFNVQTEGSKSVSKKVVINK